MGARVPEVSKQRALSSALGRAGAPEEIASVVDFLVSDAASFVTCTTTEWRTWARQFVVASFSGSEGWQVVRRCWSSGPTVIFQERSERGRLRSRSRTHSGCRFARLNPFDKPTFCQREHVYDATRGWPHGREDGGRDHADPIVRILGVAYVDRLLRFQRPPPSHDRRRRFLPGRCHTWHRHLVRWLVA
jgi:hypothetical protein